MIFYEGLQLRQDLAQHGVLPHVDWLEGDRRGAGERDLDKQALLRLFGLVQHVFDIDKECCAQLSLETDNVQETKPLIKSHLKAILRSLKTDDINTALICTAFVVPVLENELEPFFVELRNCSWCLSGSHFREFTDFTFTRNLVSICSSYQSSHHCFDCQVSAPSYDDIYSCCPDIGRHVITAPEPELGRSRRGKTIVARRRRAEGGRGEPLLIVSMEKIMFPSMLSWIMERDVDRCLFSTWTASSDFYTFLRAAPGHYDYTIVVTVTRLPVQGTGSGERVRSPLRASV